MQTCTPPIPYLIYDFFLVVINAVELMLDTFDQRISNRYKLIDYRETDFQKTIIHFSSAYFVQISIPVFLGMY